MKTLKEILKKYYIPRGTLGTAELNSQDLLDELFYHIEKFNINFRITIGEILTIAILGLGGALYFSVGLKWTIGISGVILLGIIGWGVPRIKNLMEKKGEIQSFTAFFRNLDKKTQEEIIEKFLLGDKEEVPIFQKPISSEENQKEQESDTAYLPSLTPSQLTARQWIEENDEILKKYHQKWIVVFQDQLLAEDKDGDHVREKALKKFQGKAEDLYFFYYQDFDQYQTSIPGQYF